MTQKDLKNYFSYGMWPGGGKETVSGAGSTVRYTEPLRPRLQEVLRALKVRRFLDAPCGDFNWMKHLDLTGIHYVGLDIVDQVIVENIEKYARPDVEFAVSDITKDPLPESDLMLCRDVLLHLPFAAIADLFRNILENNIQNLLISNYTVQPNKDLSTPGSARLVNLNLYPFEFPVVSPDRRLMDWIPGFPERFLDLYSRSELENILPGVIDRIQAFGRGETTPVSIETRKGALRPEELRLAIEQGDVETVRRGLSADPKSGTDFLIHASARFFVSEFPEANRLVAEMLRLNGHLVWSRWFSEFFADRLANFGVRLDVHPWFHLQAAIRKLNQGNFVEARQIAETVLDHFDVFDRNVASRLFEVIAESYLRGKSLSDPETNRYFTELVERRDPHKEKPWVSLYRGCLLFRSGQTADAEKAFQHFASSGLSPSLVAAGAGTFRPSLRSATLDGLGEVEIVRSAERSGLNFLFAADARYYSLYAPLVISSAYAHGIDEGLHFHVVDDAAPELPVVNGVPSDWVRRNVGLSWEVDPGYGKAYYACVRFVRAAEILAALRRPLVILDIDGCFTAGCEDLVRYFASCKGIVARKEVDTHLPWRSISAGFVALQDSEESKRFLRSVSEFIKGWLQAYGKTDRPSWWIDQSALALASQAEIDIARNFDSMQSVQRSLRGLPFQFAPNSAELKDKFVTEQQRRVMTLLENRPASGE
ncbi:bifunctional 2-polyprenyl-6-hydroxyphenol methylase/3-demethylubiquinol 3-O-methyltransferase UbiG [Aurantimonas sp. VKM B-3413]|uniref:class I SAM-dependent methyltransferase n=1 Tax=Aurantimonas sp. VKM B-3413 TaxID=2779401 RepID=UPI001E4A2EF0|nr:class I SAM-dependent methyltransferase [Aurantimonas sp. VKM B-3413]MCB8836481.1 class I SAM-dependent methyltransferase [Aurantimonas sp. VKM B-3413]